MGDKDRDTRSRSPRRDKDRRRDGDDKHRHRDERERERERDRRHRRDDDGRKEETEEERRERKRARREREDRKERERDERRERRKEEKRDRKRDGMEVVDDDADMWVEKDVDAVKSLGTIPTADSLPLKGTAIAAGRSPPPAAAGIETKRDAWMLGPDDAMPSSSRALDEAAPHSAGGDLFSSMGTEHKRRNADDKKAAAANPVHSKYELNTQLLEGKNVEEYKTEDKKAAAPGGPGYQWRMMKLRRLYEQAEDQNRSVEDVALERYGSLDEFHAAVEEKRAVEERESRRKSRKGGSDAHSSQPSSGVGTPARAGTPARRFVFTDSDGSLPPSRQGFRRPGEERDGAHTPSGPSGRVDALRQQNRSAFTPQAGATPIPSVFTPQALRRGTSGEAVPRTDAEGPVMTLEQLNRLQAKVLRARLSDDPDAEALEEQYERERARADATGGVGVGPLVRTDEKGNEVEVEVMPTLDGRGQLYDVGQGKEDQRTGKRPNKEAKFETRDRQGNLIRYNADDDDLTLGEMVRQERFGGGAADQKNLDAEIASRITRDARFDAGLEYMDDNAERLARKRMKTDAMKRAFAINDYKRTKKALDECPFCWQDDRNPLTAIVALGKRTYLCCTQTEELVPGHCLIVPIQHHLSTLEMDDEDWEEVKNFQKCLMRMFAAENKGVLFYETICSFRQQRHTYIECVPVPADAFADAPAYFRESILASESEWSQHKKLIDFSSRPGGFRRMLVPNMPYFAVMWDYKGEKGYGHVIEGVDEAGGVGDEDGLGGMDEGDKGGGRFPPYFAAEIIGNVLGLEARKWLRPRHIDPDQNPDRARALGTKFQPYNWTTQLQEG